MRTLTLSTALILALALAAPAVGQSAQAIQGPLTDVGSTDGRTFFVAGEPTAQNGQATMWLWHVYHAPQALGAVQIDARAERLSIDCTARTMTRTRWENYSGAVVQASGDMNSGPLGAAPGNEADRMVAVACGEDYPGKGQGLRFATLEAAIADFR